MHFVFFFFGWKVVMVVGQGRGEVEGGNQKRSTMLTVPIQRNRDQISTHLRAYLGA